MNPFFIETSESDADYSLPDFTAGEVKLTSSDKLPAQGIDHEAVFAYARTHDCFEFISMFYDDKGKPRVVASSSKAFGGFEQNIIAREAINVENSIAYLNKFIGFIASAGKMASAPAVHAVEMRRLIKVRKARVDAADMEELRTRPRERIGDRTLEHNAELERHITSKGKPFIDFHFLYDESVKNQAQFCALLDNLAGSTKEGAKKAQKLVVCAYCQLTGFTKAEEDAMEEKMGVDLKELDGVIEMSGQYSAMTRMMTWRQLREDPERLAFVTQFLAALSEASFIMSDINDNFKKLAGIATKERKRIGAAPKRQGSGKDAKEQGNKKRKRSTDE